MCEVRRTLPRLIAGVRFDPGGPFSLDRRTDLHDLLHPIQVAQLPLQRRHDVQARVPRRLVPVLDGFAARLWVRCGRSSMRRPAAAGGAPRRAARCRPGRGTRCCSWPWAPGPGAARCRARPAAARRRGRDRAGPRPRPRPSSSSSQRQPPPPRGSSHHPMGTSRSVRRCELEHGREQGVHGDCCVVIDG